MDEPVSDIFSISSGEEFEAAALEIFRYQAGHNPVYSSWLGELGVKRQQVSRLTEIPFLPVSAFRNHKVLVSVRDAAMVFASSGTTDEGRSIHYIAEPSVYEKSFTGCFRRFYGEVSDYVILALLPSYLEQGRSSLVYMVEKLISMSGSGVSGFFLHDHGSLKKRIEILKESGKKFILLGVSYALLDFSEAFDISLKGNIVMETGGMKGRRREMTRDELHSILKERFDIDEVHSEYGMTEMLSQAYSKKDGIYYSPPWMKVVIRDPLDPFAFLPHGRTGGVNIIDLANIYSCSFLETSDLGLLTEGGGFSISGRFDNSDVRGCNLLAL